MPSVAHTTPQQTWTPPSSPSAPAVTLPSKFVSDDHHDSTSVFGFSLKKIVEATHWSRKKGFSARDVMDIRPHELMFHGTEEWALRLLSLGRFVSVIPTRSVAESVIMSQILSVLRKKHYDIDGAAEALWRHVHPGKEPPSKTNEPTKLFQPMVDNMIQSVDSFAPIQQGAAASQNLIKLETELQKRKQQLRQQGVMLTPEKPATTEPKSATSSGPKPGDLPLPVVGQEHQRNDQDLAKLDPIPEVTLKPYVRMLEALWPIVSCSASVVQNLQENVGSLEVRRV